MSILALVSAISGGANAVPKLFEFRSGLPILSIDGVDYYYRGVFRQVSAGTCVNVFNNTKLTLETTDGLFDFTGYDSFGNYCVVGNFEKINDDVIENCNTGERIGINLSEE